jgi:hypothetical protein
MKSKIAVPIYLIIGAVCIASAIVKLIAIDRFDLYLYGLNFLNLKLTSLFSRLFIAFEIGCGVLLFIPVGRKTGIYLTLLLLVLYAAYLIAVLVLRPEADCQCSGPFTRLTHVELLFMSMILFVFLFLVRNQPSVKRQNVYFIGLVFLSAISIITILFPTRLIFRKHHTPAEQFNFLAFNSISRKESILGNDSTNGRMMLCFFSPGCKYCKLAAQKISLMVTIHSIPDERILYIFRKKTGDLNEFFEDSNFQRFRMNSIDSKSFFQITGGIVPLILLVEGSDVYFAYNYRNINESEVVNFLGNFH